MEKYLQLPAINNTNNETENVETSDIDEYVEKSEANNIDKHAEESEVNNTDEHIERSIESKLEAEDNNDE